MGRVRFEDRGAALIRTVRRLPALVDLSIYYYDWRGDELAVIRDNAGLPRCEELAELRSQSLTKLHVSMLGGPGNSSPLRLSGLPELRTCQLCGAGSWTRCWCCMLMQRAKRVLRSCRASACWMMRDSSSITTASGT